MRRQTILQAIGPLLIVAAGVAAFSWLQTLGVRPVTSPVADKPPPVRTRVLGPPREGFDIRIGGRVVPHREVTLSAEVTGRVIARPDNLRAGRHVSRGTKLLQIDPADYQLELSKITSRLSSVDLDLEQLETESAGIEKLVALAKEDLSLASRELARIESLLERKATAPAERDRAKRTELEARNSLRELVNQQNLVPLRRRQFSAQRQVLVAQQERTSRDIARTQIVAPFDGLLTLDGAEVGDFVQPGDILLKIEEAAVVEIECQLRADELDWLRDSRTTANDAGNIASPFEVPDVAVTVTYQDTTNRWTGRLTRFRGQGVDPRTRTVPCRVLVDRRRDSQTATGSSLLMRGMYVTVALPVVPTTPLIEIPTEALRPDGQVWSVSNDRLVIHRVEVVRVLRDSVLIRADSTRLTPDDHVVVSPLATTYDGMTVRVRKADASSGQGDEGSPSP
jgi:multidrug efflux pump subunit AcrA (membrane-fusion protein)